MKFEWEDREEIIHGTSPLPAPDNYQDTKHCSVRCEVWCVMCDVTESDKSLHSLSAPVTLALPGPASSSSHFSFSGQPGWF